MEIKKQLGHQGDTQWFSIDTIPSTAKLINKKFIAASERSGSFHALFGDYEMYTIDGGFVIDAKEECILNHSLQSELDKVNNDLDSVRILTKKDHRHAIISKGKYLVGNQNRFDPMENSKKLVKD